MKKNVALLLTLIMVFSVCGCMHQHTWKDATCTEAKTCTACGATEGEALGHTWKDATCTEAKTCAVCGATEGEALGHTWKEATCTEAKTCTVCGATEGEALGHDAAWETVKSDNIAGTRSMVSKCTVCGVELDAKEEAIESFIDGKAFTFTAEEFVERLQNTWNAQRQESLELKFKYAVNSRGNVNFDYFNRNDVWLGWGLFYDENGNAIEASNGDVPICSLKVIIGPVDDLGTDALFFLLQRLIGPVSCAVDPSIKNDMYEDPISDNLYAYDSGKSLNGLYYTCGYAKEKGYFTLDIDIAGK